MRNAMQCYKRIKRIIYPLFINHYLKFTPATKSLVSSFSLQTFGIGSAIPLKMSSYSTSTRTSSSVQSTSSFSISANRNNDNDILWDFATHTNESYHYFKEEEADEIRKSLLEWYRCNRRKLPWRGDPPPYDGSTAGINSSSLSSVSTIYRESDSNKRKRKKIDKKEDQSQKSIKSFFSTTTATEPTVSKKAKIKNESIDDQINLNDTQKDNDYDNSNGDEKDIIIPITGYSVWVSEIMLQQTRVEAVIPYYVKWMKAFPTVHDLANATEDEVNSHWAGLGFYRRARLLHKGSKYVANELNGTMPKTVDELLKIDGIGRYTASAIASIAFQACVPVVDGNVCRVLARLKGIANHIKAPVMKDGIGWKLADQIVKAGDGLYAGEVNQAMMELGATYCAPGGSGVDEKDPLKQFYSSTKIGTKVHEFLETELFEFESVNGIDQDKNKSFCRLSFMNDFLTNASSVRGHVQKCGLCDPDGIDYVLCKIVEDLNDTQCQGNPAIVGHATFPTPPPKKSKREEVLVVAAISCDFGEDKGGLHWLMVKRPSGGLLSGQWEFPSQCIWSSSDLKPKFDKTTKKKDILEVPSFSFSQRSDAIIELLQQFDFNSKQKQAKTVAQLWTKKGRTTYHVNADTPMEHVFSHVRHSMWIQHSEFSQRELDTDLLQSKNSYFLLDGRQYKWMNHDDMKSVGITSAINKILASVKKYYKSEPSRRKNVKKT